MLDTVYGNIAVSHVHILEWLKRFREGCEYHKDDLKAVTK